ncbi:Rpn family recombination-promoting nuclease/putative transposase [Synechococcus sp. PCC 6312]|uniref:Rpn family recombination-promoting nuclease/putative transposase n=1 Tax=Synechococcus sp. (strain ATCC 27167 / PCC 6312) TaxID=195253 RepID=UPI00029F26D0|nr:Rpn family recombination-promoting nuclease/putative transposase [Synechococcus sp. PCC 6312]AFY59308.1 hypothetical protein Syn6312_0052 [Synechococcus sp. PCC 6312]
MFDNTCKFLAETFPEDFAVWLLGELICFGNLSPGELSLEPIHADSLILLDSPDLILHLEFQTQPDPLIPFRMADYRLRVYRRFPRKQMRQVVTYLLSSNSGLVQQTTFEISGMRHEFSVIRLWEQPTPTFLGRIGLLPLAVLSQTANPQQVLQSVSETLGAIADQRTQSNITASTAILAGLLLEETVIQNILRREIMKESSVYQVWRQEFIQEGREEGRVEGEKLLIQRLLAKKIGDLPGTFQSQVNRLSLPQLEKLGEALLTFETVADLQAWLKTIQA